MMDTHTITTAVIVAGGKGTRLCAHTKSIPKPMIPINGKPILQRQIEALRKYNISNIYITVNYLKDAIMDFFSDGSSFGVKIHYIEEKTPLGTGGAFYYLRSEIKSPFFVVYGDVIFDLDLSKISLFHFSHQRMITLLAHPNSHPYDSDIIYHDEYWTVTNILSKHTSRVNIYYNNLVNAGFYCMNPEILNFFSAPEVLDLEKDILKHYVKEKQVIAYKTTEYLKDMGTIRRLEEVETALTTGILDKRNLSNPQKCIFLDRDGTLNIKKGLITDPDEMELEAHVAEAIRCINNSEYLSIVVTNQPVIARNLCDFQQLTMIHQQLEMLLGNEGAYLDDIFFCPHHPDGGYPEERKAYKIKCDCRKPEIGMILNAAKKYSIDLTKSYMIGDTTADILAGIRAGMKTILLKTGEAGQDNKYKVIPDYICNNLLEAVRIILK